MLTKEILDALDDDYAFERLLDSYGVWTRISRGCPSAGTVPTEHGYAAITEESAEIIAAVTCEFKKERPGLYRFFHWYYHKGQDAGDIRSFCKGISIQRAKHRRLSVFEAHPWNVVRYMTIAMINQKIFYSRDWMRDKLKQMRGE